MDLLATGNTVTPGLPARTRDAANEGEKTDESATFEVFLDLALTVPSPEADMATGPEGKLPAGDVEEAAQGGTGNPATPPGNILPLVLPAVAPVGVEPAAAPGLDAEVPVGNAPMQPVRPQKLTQPAAAPAQSDGPSATPAVALAVAKPAEALAQTAQAPAPQPPAQVAAIEAITMAQVATPVISVLAGRQRGAAPVRATETSDAPAQPAPTPAPASVPLSASAAPLPVVQPTVPPAAQTHDTARQAAPLPAPSHAVTAQAEASEAPSSRAPVEAAPAQPVNLVPAQAEPIAPLADSRISAPATGVTPSAPASASQSAPHDFGDLVDRLVRARETEQPDLVRSTLATRDFGTVAMQLRSVDGRLHVALSASDPAFAPAVQAASAMAGAGQQALSDNASQSQSQGQQQQGQAAMQSGQGQSAADGQARRQQWERAAEGQSAQAAARAPDHDGSAPANAPRNAASGAIYA
jgi:hypothetical protein